MIRHFRRVLGLVPDPFLFGLVFAAAIGTVLPCSGVWATFFRWLMVLAIGVMFFMQGVRLSRAAVIAGMTHWRVHLAILACTFVLYPVLGLALRAVARPVLPDQLWIGVVFLCLLPSTVQSSIAYVSIARGNVAAAVCAATASNLLGIFITPVLASLVLATSGAGPSFDDVGKIAANILAPFVVGQILQPHLAAWAGRNKALLTISDRGAILLAVYIAFSAAALEGVWNAIPPLSMLYLLGLEAVMLAFVLAITFYGARAAGFSIEDQIAIVFCGSKKSLASGAPMASVLFPAATLSVVMIPLVLFHQMQLVAAAFIAKRLADDPTRAPAERPAAP
ncbi:MAG: bile acid:sodium symporter family protein [Alphaproteobacteria bacterium]